MKSLKLNAVENKVLTTKEMSSVKGGGWTCTCSCYYAGSGGASIEDNGNANLSSPGGKVSEKGDCKWSGVVVTP